MGRKGEETKKRICKEAYPLFSKKGFHGVTMQDICERTGLSRGGLYRHYSSTEQIFREIITALLDQQQDEFRDKIDRKVPAAEILNQVLARYEREMLDGEGSLSLAIYEYFSDPRISKSENAISRQYARSKRMWQNLLEYGVRTGEFQRIDPEAVYDLIVFSYQGVRMYGKLMEIEERIPAGIVRQIKRLLLNEEGKER